jgi:hypothetical protein
MPSTSGKFALLLVMALPACTYQLQGRVISGGFGTVTLVDASDDRLQSEGVQGVRIQLVRDPQRLRREVIATCSSGRDGRFTLETRTFGAGWTDERWEIVATRSGHGSAQSPIELPIDPGSRRLLIELERGGESEATGSGTAPRSILDEAQQYDPSIKPRLGGN